jgi:endonuclease YncB( thermonuclease family)
MIKLFILSIALTLSASSWKSATVKRVVDGDTIVIKTQKGIKKARLIGFDTPESFYNRKLLIQSKRCDITPARMVTIGTISKRYTLQRLKKGSKIDYISFGEDYFDRELIWIRGFNYRIVSDGFAKAYKRADLPKAIKARLKDAEKEARAKKIGIWSLLSLSENKRCY